MYTVTIHWKEKPRGREQDEVSVSALIPEETIATLTLVDERGHVRKYPWSSIAFVEYWSSGE